MRGGEPERALGKILGSGRVRGTERLHRVEQGRDRHLVAELSAVGQLRRNLDGKRSSCELYLRAVAVQRAAYRRGHTRPYRVADQVMPEGQPFAGLSQNARFDKLCGLALPALERTTSGPPRAGDRERRRGP